METLGQTKKTLLCVSLCVFDIRVGDSTVGRVQGSGGLTPHSPSAAGSEAGRGMRTTELQHSDLIKFDNLN